MREGAASPGPSMRDRMTRAHTLLFAAFIATTSLTALADGDAAAGRTLYQMRCTVCHSLDYNGVGPAHHGVFGRAAAQTKGFAHSDALKASRLVWTEDTLDRWLADPEKSVPGQRMGIDVPDAQDRADLIAHLKQAAAAK